MTIKEIKNNKKISQYVKMRMIESRRFELSVLKKRRDSGQCCAILHHGPGHQSSTFCEKKGNHRIHSCTYGSHDQYMKWKEREEFTGYFDEPKELQ